MTKKKFKVKRVVRVTPNNPNSSFEKSRRGHIQALLQTNPACNHPDVVIAVELGIIGNASQSIYIKFFGDFKEVTTDINEYKKKNIPLYRKKGGKYERINP